MSYVFYLVVFMPSSFSTILKIENPNYEEHFRLELVTYSKSIRSGNCLKNDAEFIMKVTRIWRQARVSYTSAKSRFSRVLYWIYYLLCSSTVTTYFLLNFLSMKTVIHPICIFWKVLKLKIFIKLATDDSFVKPLKRHYHKVVYTMSSSFINVIVVKALTIQFCFISKWSYRNTENLRMDNKELLNRTRYIIP